MSSIAINTTRYLTSVLPGYYLNKGLDLLDADDVVSDDKPDYAGGFRYFKLAAEQGYTEAEDGLGWMYWSQRQRSGL